VLLVHGDYLAVVTLGSCLLLVFVIPRQNYEDVVISFVPYYRLAVRSVSR